MTDQQEHIETLRRRSQHIIEFYENAPEWLKEYKGGIGCTVQETTAWEGAQAELDANRAAIAALERERWRKWPDEKPTSSGHYLLILRPHLYAVDYFDGEDWANHYFASPREPVTHYRPIGPLPEDGE